MTAKNAKKEPSITPLHGLLVLALVGLFAGLAGTAAKLVKISGGESDLPAGGCLYVVYRDRECLGAVSLQKPASLSDIVNALDHNLSRKSVSGNIPCRTAIRLSKDMRLISYGIMSGNHLLCAGRRIDVNRARPRDLVPVPGIGLTLAHRIVQHRNSSGNFRNIQELREVPGIGKEKLSRIGPFLMIGNVESRLPASGRPDRPSSL